MSALILDHPIKIGIAGADGKMGQMLLRQVLSESRAQVNLQAALVLADSPHLHKTVGTLIGNDCPLVLTADIDRALQQSDVLIDFTCPAGTMAHLACAQRYGKAMVIGTTGFSADEMQALQSAAQNIPMIVSTNMAPGVHILFALARQAAKLLPDYHAEIFELHHQHKVDAPSGTALTLGEQVLIGRKKISETAGVAQARAQLIEQSDFARNGRTGARLPNRIGFSAARGGDVIGEHTLMLIGQGERLELKHISSSRAHYAYGAVLAAKFLAHMPAGAYDMAQVLSLNAFDE